MRCGLAFVLALLISTACSGAERDREAAEERVGCAFDEEVVLASNAQHARVASLGDGFTHADANGLFVHRGERDEKLSSEGCSQLEADAQGGQNIVCAQRERRAHGDPARLLLARVNSSQITTLVQGGDLQLDALRHGTLTYRKEGRPYALALNGRDAPEELHLLPPVVTRYEQTPHGEVFAYAHGGWLRLYPPVDVEAAANREANAMSVAAQRLLIDTRDLDLLSDDERTLIAFINEDGSRGTRVFVGELNRFFRIAEDSLRSPTSAAADGQPRLMRCGEQLYVAVERERHSGERMLTLNRLDEGLRVQGAEHEIYRHGRDVHDYALACSDGALRIAYAHHDARADAVHAATLRCGRGVRDEVTP